LIELNVDPSEYSDKINFYLSAADDLSGKTSYKKVAGPIPMVTNVRVAAWRGETMQKIRAVLATVAVGALSATAAAQQPSADDVNKANNPLTPAIAVNFQDQGEPELYDLDQGANALLLRGVLPHKLGGLPQIVRYTLPVVTTPNGNRGEATGLGDLNLFDLAIFPLKSARMVVAVGPQFTFPTASETLTGTGKWQAGTVAAAVALRKWGIAGVLLTWQHSFAGDEARSG
jgi:hypothetical protein